MAYLDLEQLIIPDPLCIAPDQTLAETIALMGETYTQEQQRPHPDAASPMMTYSPRASCVIVKSPEVLLGIITERDIIHCMSQGKDPRKVLAKEVMTQPILTIKHTDIYESFRLIEILKQSHCRHLPVVDEADQLLGLVTHTSLQSATCPEDLLKMRLVADVMIDNVITAPSNTSLLEISRQMIQHRISAVVITVPHPGVASKQKPVGLITEQDLIQAQQAGQTLQATQAQAVMDSFPLIVAPQESLWVVNQIMTTQGRYHLLVVDSDQTLQGIITASDILRAINPLELLKVTELLRQRIQVLEQEQLSLLENQNQRLVRAVRKQTASLLRKAKQEKLYQALSIQILSAGDLDVILKTTVEGLRKLVQCERVIIWQFDGQASGKAIAEATNSPIRYLGRTVAMSITCQESLQHQDNHLCFISHNGIQDESHRCEHFGTCPYLKGELNGCSGALLGLWYNDEPWGLLQISETRSPRTWTKEEIQLFQIITTQVAIALQKVITQKKLQRELIQKEAATFQLREAQRIAKLGHWEYDLKHDNLTWSHQIFDIFEVDPRTFQPSYQAFIATIHPEDRKLVRHAYNQHLATGLPYKITHRLLMADGRIKYVHEQCETLTDKNGYKISKGTIQDITPLKQAQQQLEQLNQQLEQRIEARTKELQLEQRKVNSFLNNASDLVQSIDLKSGRFEYVNNAWYYKLGYSELDLIYLTFWDILDPQDHEQFHNILNAIHTHVDHPNHQGKSQLLSKNQKPIPQQIKIRLRSKNQQIILVEGSLDLRHENSQPVALQGIFRDITERQKIETKMQLQLRALNTASDGIAIVKNDRYVFMNEAHAQIFGYDSPQELIGKQWEILYNSRELEWFSTDVFPILMAQKTWRGETVARRKDNSTFDEELSLTVLEDDILICVCRDISERKKAELELQSKNRELARATRLKDQFLANMSHELRTPLNAILGMSEGLQEEIFGPLAAAQKKALNTIQHSGTHLLSLINDILDIAKIEAEQMEFEFIRTPLGSICLEGIDFVKHLAHQKNIAVDLQLPAQLPDVVVDGRRILQVLINLLNNAVKFTPDHGQITVGVSVYPYRPEPTETMDEATRPNPSRTMAVFSASEKTSLRFPHQPEKPVRDYLRITVTDTGIGIAEADLEKLFKPFVQIDSSLNRKYAGTGLGLALVKDIIQAHGGRVGVMSEQGKGSCFYFDLPCLEMVYATTMPGTQTLGGSELVSTDSSQSLLAEREVRVLLVEDNPSNVRTISSYLKAKGYQVIAAQNGMTGVELTVTEHPDIILMDIQMPDMDGLEATRQIRRQMRDVAIPIIALTALAMHGDHDLCLAAGADTYMTKPVSLKELTATIERLLSPLGSG
ncbi:MAG: CBS domain-containing protein [Synechococcus sp.]|nr:CBS domain-containing protein [Synechococcus sp.]